MIVKILVFYDKNITFYLNVIVFRVLNGEINIKYFVNLEYNILYKNHHIYILITNTKMKN